MPCTFGGLPWPMHLTKAHMLGRNTASSWQPSRMGINGKHVVSRRLLRSSLNKRKWLCLLQVEAAGPGPAASQQQPSQWGRRTGQAEAWQQPPASSSGMGCAAASAAVPPAPDGVQGAASSERARLALLEELDGEAAEREALRSLWSEACIEADGFSRSYIKRRFQPS